MVYVPILKIDLPEPRLQQIIPGLVTASVGACTAAFDAVYGFLHPLPAEGQLMLYETAIAGLPREFRKARKRIVELDVQDDEKMSEELETASFNYYRRRMREEVCGFSDEGAEDVTFRRLMTPESASRDLRGPTDLDEAIMQQDLQAIEQLLLARHPQQAAPSVFLPSRVRRATVTTAVGGAGVALGAGMVKLLQLVASRMQKKKRRAKRRSSAAGQPGSRRQSEQGTTAGGSSRRISSTRITPRQR